MAYGPDRPKKAWVWEWLQGHKKTNGPDGLWKKFYTEV